MTIYTAGELESRFQKVARIREGRKEYSNDAGY